jgi:hypothetical protein
MRRLLCVLALTACQAPGSGNESGLVVVSDTAQMGPPPVCEGGSSSDTGDGSSGGESGAVTEAAFDEGASLSSRTGGSRAADPGTSFCAAFTSSAACDGTPRLDGERLIGECRWVTVVPVLPGTCEATQLYNTCVHVPLDGSDCEAAQSCGQIGLGIYGRAGCDGTVEMIVVPPGQAFCAAPTDWPLCWPDDSSPECSCVCS